jgi:hypothetical protein
VPPRLFTNPGALWSSTRPWSRYISSPVLRSATLLWQLRIAARAHVCLAQGFREARGRLGSDRINGLWPDGVQPRQDGPSCRAMSGTTRAHAH